MLRALRDAAGAVLIGLLIGLPFLIETFRNFWSY